MLTQFISVIRKIIRIGLIGSCSGAIAGSIFGMLVGLSFSFVAFFDATYPDYGLETIQGGLGLYIYLPALFMTYGCLFGTIVGSIPGVIAGYVLVWSGKIAPSPQWGATVGGLIGLVYPIILIYGTLATTSTWTTHARSELLEGIFSLPLLALFGVIAGRLGGRVFRYWANKYLT